MNAVEPLGTDRGRARMRAATVSLVVAAILLTAGLADAFGISSLLSCLLFGFVLANLAPENEDIGHTVFDNVSLDDSGPRADPLIGCVDHLLEIVVGQDPLGQRRSPAGDHRTAYAGGNRGHQTPPRFRQRPWSGDGVTSPPSAARRSADGP